MTKRIVFCHLCHLLGNLEYMRNTLKKSDISISNRIDSFYEFIEEKIKGGWKRNDVYLVIEEITDAIYEFKTSLIGDPEDDEDLARYVRSNIWKDNYSE